MSVITDVCLTILEICHFAWTFLVDTVEGIVWCIGLLAHFTLNIPDYLGWLPAQCLGPLVLVFGVAVTYKILGREG